MSSDLKYVFNPITGTFDLINVGSGFDIDKVLTGCDGEVLSDHHGNVIEDC